ncbi:MAG: hypothetical protein LBS09_00115 [Bacteroidales bacterium]|jgi:hypothetical protein|nr:hypothetical protein [Bacteroidales bacterium]
MPSYIPYSHPSLQVGSTVSPELLAKFNQLNALQQGIDAAHDVLNSHIMMRRSLSMTINELSDMKVDTAQLTGKLPEIDSEISKAAQSYLDTKIKNETEIQRLRSEMSGMEAVGGDPVIDLGASRYVTLPLSAESLNMDSQYFSFGSNIEDDMIANIEKFIRTGTSNIPSVSDKTAKDVSAQITNQVKNHSISGTLIIVASCTHRNIGTFQPLVIDAEKAVQVWNDLHKNNQIDMKQDLTKIQDGGGDDSISVITGASYGSSFVGMVHILKADSKQTGEFEKLKAGFENNLRIGGWLANTTGGFGVNEDALSDIRAFLSNQSINCHVSIITTGAIPDIASHELSLSIDKLAMVDKATIQRALTIDGSEIFSTDAKAYEAKQKALLLNIENARVSQILQNVQKIDERKNKTLDINSLMDAFTNYIRIISGKGNKGSGDLITGTPVNFYTKRLIKSDIARLLVRKYQAEITAAAKPEATKPEEAKPAAGNAKK